MSYNTLRNRSDININSGEPAFDNNIRMFNQLSIMIRKVKAKYTFFSQKHDLARVPRFRDQ